MVAGTMRTYATLPSNAYTDPANLHDSATANSPEDISYDHRKIIERALRVDHAGEVAANWIYKGQLAILGNDRKVGLIIQVSRSLCLLHASAFNFDLGNVGPGEETFGSHGSLTSATSRTADCSDGRS